MLEARVPVDFCIIRNKEYNMKNCSEKVFVGVDCHKNSIACFVNEKFKEFKTDFKGFNKALEWVKQQNIASVWALEGAYS